MCLVAFVLPVELSDTTMVLSAELNQVLWTIVMLSWQASQLALSNLCN